jgi:hypothetical protein
MKHVISVMLFQWMVLLGGIKTEIIFTFTISLTKAHFSILPWPHPEDRLMMRAKRC